MTDLLRAIFNIFKGLFTVLSYLRALVFNLLFIAVIAIIIVSLFWKKDPVIPFDSILKLSISGDIVESRSTSEPINEYFGEIIGLPEEPQETVLQDILDALEQARHDENISAVLLDLSTMGYAGLNQLQTIGAAITTFKSSGKPVIAAEDYFSQNQYYLASYADKIFLNPLGGVTLTGFGFYRFYFQEALEKLKINFHVFQVGTYKSALEPFTRNSMSPEDRSQSRAWLSTLWSHYVETISRQRSIKPEAISSFINDIPDNLKKVDGDLAQLALQSGLVDELRHRASIRKYLSELAPNRGDEEPRLVPFDLYRSTFSPSYSDDDSEKDMVALIIAQGSIMPGDSAPGTIGADSLIQQIKRARTSENIKAVVLRLDSGGGSAFASEVIRQELLALKEAGKPLIVSMGTFAASGAYWISADADEIWASPTTLTGSIGIFMAFPTFESTLANLGVHRDGLGTTNLSASFDLSQPLSTEVREAIQLTLDNGYRMFLQVVSNGRLMQLEQVEKIAQGRVYSGTEALKIGLVDKLGSLEQAIEAAAASAGLSRFGITTLSQPLSLQQRLFSSLREAHSLNDSIDSFVTEIGGKFLRSNPAIQSLLHFKDPNGMYSHCMIHYY